MSQTAVQTATATPAEKLPIGRVRHGQAGFPQEEFQTFQDVPVFAEHVTKRKDGETLEFGRNELEAIARRCNRRIQETGDYAVLTLGHTPDPDDPNGKDPEVVGYAGPYKVGLVGQPGGAHRYAILADFHVFKDKAGEVKSHPRRSPELWLADSPEDMFLDPIALLGAQPPRLDMGMLYAAKFQGRERLKYTAVAPSASSVFVPKEYECKEGYEKGFDESKHPRAADGKFGEGGGGKGPTEISGVSFEEGTRPDLRKAIDNRDFRVMVGRILFGNPKDDGIPLGKPFLDWIEKEWNITAPEAGLAANELFGSGSQSRLWDKLYLPSMEKYSKQIIQGDKSVLDPEEVQQILDAMEQLDWVQAAKAQQAANIGPNATPGLEPQLPMADPMAAIPPEVPGEMPAPESGAMPPEAGAMPPEGLGEVPPEVPGAMPPEAPGEMPMEEPGPPAAEPMPEAGAMPQEEEAMPPEAIAPPVEKEEQFPSEDGPDEAKKKLKDSMDAMSDEDMEEYVRVRKIGRYATEGTAVGPDPETPPASGDAQPNTEGQIGKGSADEQYQKSREKSAMAEKLGQDGHTLKQLQATVAKLQQELDEERGLRVDAERYALLSERRQHRVFDLDQAVERAKYGKMSADQFTGYLGDIEDNYRPIPVGQSLPLHGRGIDQAAAATMPKADRDKAKYAKQDSQTATKMCLEAANNGEKLDYSRVLEDIESKRNGAAATT